MRFAPICAALLLLTAAAACGEKLPQDPGLLSDDLGVGLTLGMPAELAREASVPTGVKLLVVTGEEFAGINPYNDQEPGSELLVALYNAGSEQVYREGVSVFDPVVSIKGFPSLGDPSRLELLGTGLSNLTPGDVVAKLGEPQSRSNSSDGATHLGYTFRSDELKVRNIAGMFSFDFEGRCFAFEISLTLLQ